MKTAPGDTPSRNRGFCFAFGVLVAGTIAGLTACDRTPSPNGGVAGSSSPSPDMGEATGSPVGGAGPAFALLSETGTADPFAEGPPAGWVWRRNARERVAVAAPARWVFFEKVFRQQNDAVIVLYPPAEKLLQAAEAHLSIRVHVMPEDVRFGQYVIGHERASVDRQGKRVLTSDGTRVGEWSAHRWTFEGAIEGKPRKELTYAVAMGQRVYHMAFLAPEATYEKRVADAERVMTSLRESAAAKDPVAAAEAAPVVLRSDDGRTELRLPPGWTDARPLEAEALIQAHRPEGSLTAAVSRVGERAEAADLKREAAARARELEAVLDEATVGEPEELKVNGRAAARCHVGGASENIRLAYDVWVVDTGHYVHCVVVGSGESWYELRKQELAELVTGLREVEGAKTVTGESDGGKN